MVKNYSKKTVFILTALLLFTAELFSQQLLVGNDKIVKVNNKIITVKDLKDAHEQMRMFYIQAGQAPLTEKEVLKTLVDAELLKKAIKTSSMVADETRVNQQLDMFRMQYSQQMMQVDPNFKFDEAIFRKYLENEGGKTYEEVVENVELQVLQQQYVQKRAQAKLQALMSKTYPDEKLRAFRQQYLSRFVEPKAVIAKHIFFQTIDAAGGSLSASEKERIRKKANDVLNRLKKGESFDKLCEFNSDDASSRDQVDEKTGKLNRGYLGPIYLGGEQGERVRNQFGETIFTKLGSYAANSYTSVMEGPFGFHIFRILEHKPERIRTFEEAKPEIVQFFRMQEQQQIIAAEYAKLIEELHKKADIKYYKEEYRQ